MVKNYLEKIVVGLFLTIIFYSSAASQNHKGYSVLQKYRKWGFIVGPVLYNRAKINPKYGDYTFDNKPIWGFNAGFEYDFFPDKKWSFVTGFIVALEPVFNGNISFKKEDIYSFYEEEDLQFSIKEYAITSFSAPLLVRLNLKIRKKIFVNFLTGFKIMFFPRGTSEIGIIFHSEDNTETREVFGLRVESPDNGIQGSFVVGAGASLAIKKMLLKANLVYIMNFQNTFEGEYQFDNLLTSPPSRGDYTLSGNYVGLLFTINLLKKNIDELEY